MERRDLRVLVSWYIDPRYIPPFRVSERQVTVGPVTKPDQPRLMFDGITPMGQYDLEAAVKSQFIEPSFDLIVVFADAGGTNRPLNLAAFSCPKVLCVGDTHHLPNPISKMLPYAKEAGFDHVVLAYTRQHLHWFVEAGLSRVAWIPGITVQHVPRPFHREREPRLVFIGTHAQSHPRRHFLLDGMESDGFPVLIGEGTREEAADHYASSLISFNCSLNGDLNMRVFEVLSASGCLLTDRLAPEAGLGLLFTEGRHLLCYDSPEELSDKAEFLLRRPQAALRLARAGAAAYAEHFLPERQIVAILDWVLDDRLDEIYRPDGDPRAVAQPVKPGWFETRLRIYEELQRGHRKIARPRVLFGAGLPPDFAEDAIDLPRMTRAVAPLGPERPGAAWIPPIGGRIEFLTWTEAVAQPWDYVIAAEGAPVNQNLQGARLLTV